VATARELERGDQYREYYVNRAPSARGEGVLRAWHAGMLRLARAWVPGTGRGPLLEVGAGFGFFADVCRDQGIPYEGLEMNADQAARLQERGHEVKAGAIPPFPEGEPVATIWMSHVLEHASTYLEARAMVSSALDRLEPGGALVVIGPDAMAWRNEFWNTDWSHGFPTTARRVAQMLQDCGYEIVAERHHTATVGNPVAAQVLALLFRLIPHRLIDLVLVAAIGRPLAHSFMAVFGWRQIFVAGRKPA
jgi:SAM-dependent methyltransferase